MKRIAINAEGKIEVHMKPKGAMSNHDTVCGLDAADPPDFYEVPVPKNAKINCPHCWEMWNECKRFRRNDFSTPVESEE